VFKGEPDEVRRRLHCRLHDGLLEWRWPMLDCRGGGSSSGVQCRQQDWLERSRHRSR
jgi:hypothetical protein